MFGEDCATELEFTLETAMPPTHNSSACVVVAVVPVSPAALYPVATEVLSKYPVATIPEYSQTSATAPYGQSMLNAIVMPVPALAETTPTQTSDTKAAAVYWFCNTLDQDTLVCVIEFTVGVESPAPPMTATKMLPFIGAAPNVKEMLFVVDVPLPFP